MSNKQIYQMNVINPYNTLIKLIQNAEEKYYGRLSDDQNQNYTETLSRFEHIYK